MTDKHRLARWMVRLAAKCLPVLSRCGRPGRWVLHRLGFRAFLSETFTRAHAPDCARSSVTFDLRPHGWVKRCDGCRQPIELHFACWETEDGYMPAEVTTWIAEELTRLTP